MARTRSSRTRATSAAQQFQFEVWPTEFRVITQHFGARPLYYARFGLPGHEGIDLQAPDGSKVFCVAPGTVRRVNEDDGVHPYGCNVRVEHDSGYETIYAHLQEAAVQEGQAVAAGDTLGLAGHSGNAEGAHLHLTLKKARARHAGYPNNIVDPTSFLMAMLVPDTDDAQYVRDTVPDGTTMREGQKFEQTWFLRNSGASTWSEGYTLVHTAGPELGAPPTVPLPPAPPGAEVPVTIGFCSPPQRGRHRSVWQACDPGGDRFGDPVWVEIEVPGAAPGPAGLSERFVQRRGRDLYWQGQPFRFVGANLRGLVHYGRRTSDPLKFSQLEHRESQLRAAATMGVRVARLFLPDKDASFDEIENRLRETLDIVKHQFPELFLLPVLTNLYNDVPFYVPGDEGFFAKPEGDSRDLLTREFFAEGYRTNYLPFVKKIVTSFQDEPRIFAWEIGNELKLDRRFKSDPNDANPNLFVQFNLDVAAHIKRLDPNHLVTTGMKSTHHAWLHTAAQQEALYSSPNIDFITIHSYEGMWDQEGDRRVYDDAPLAARLGKPFIVEEAGFDVHVFADRLPKYEEHLEIWLGLGARGYMPWGFNHRHEIGDGDHDVGIGASHSDFPQLFDLFRRTAGEINSRAGMAFSSISTAVHEGALRATERSSGLDLVAYNRAYLDNQTGEPVNDAEALGVYVTTAEVGAGETFWKVIGIHQLTPDENDGRQTVIVELLDEMGRLVRDPDLSLQWGWAGQAKSAPSPPKTLDQGDGAPAANLDFFAGQHLWVRVGGGLPSETVANLRAEHPVGRGGNAEVAPRSQSFYVVFQRTTSAAPANIAPERAPLLAPIEPNLGPHVTVGMAGHTLPAAVEAPKAAVKIGIDANAPIDPATGAAAAQVRDPSIISATGAGWVRINFVLGPWSSPADPSRREGLTWTETYRSIVEGFRGCGLQVYGLIGHEAVRTPIGDRFRTAPPGSHQRDGWIQEYVNAFLAIARMFRSEITVFESFNEPDDWHGRQQNWIHPGWFATMLEGIYTAVSADPSLHHLTLVSGPLQGLEGEHKGNGAREYLDRTYQAGTVLFGWGRAGKPFPFDGVGYHLYVHERYLPDPVAQEQAIRHTYRRYLREMQDVIQRYEGREKPLYISELGWFTNGDRESMEQFQAHSLQASMRCLLEEPAVALAINFCTQDFGQPHEGKYYGLYRQGDLAADSRKAAFRVFQRICALPVQPSWIRHTPGATPAPRDDAAYVPGHDTIPDGTIMQPGQRFAQSWVLRNTGHSQWTAGYQAVWTGEKNLGAPHRVPIPPCDPGQEIPVTVPFLAPEESGRHRSIWRLCNAHDNVFGDPFWVDVEVVAAPAASPHTAPVLEAVAHDGAVPPLPGLVSSLATIPATEARLAAAAWLGIIYNTYWTRLAYLGNLDDLSAVQSTLEAITRQAIAEVRDLMDRLGA